MTAGRITFRSEMMNPEKVPCRNLMERATMTAT